MTEAEANEAAEHERLVQAVFEAAAAQDQYVDDDDPGHRHFSEHLKRRHVHL